ncbi:MAG: SoxR reducing system RseC family protein [Candidatus Limiplasma sp.]|nr:SoxR reducing system RseC family protein [Candidatus Limiplasma sp.]MEA5146346.1 SoxR reducing system RseC family protein [Candidatus Limiplasma sp.]
MTKFGQVYAIDPVKGLASIRFSRPEACGKCGACGAGVHQGDITLKAQCQVGNWVRVEMPEGRFLTATALAYVVPLLALFAGLGLGSLLGQGHDLAAMVGGLIGILVSIGFLKLVEKRIKGKSEWSPRIVEVYQAAPDEAQIGCHID